MVKRIAPESDHPQPSIMPQAGGLSKQHPTKGGCPLSAPRTYISVCLAAEGMAYEARLTGNQEHLRILREGLREAFQKSGSDDGKSLAQFIHFTPYALEALETR